METLIHTMHVVAIKDARAWSGMTPAQLSMLGFWNLIFVWLKVRRKIQSIYDAKLILSDFSRMCRILGGAAAFALEILSIMGACGRAGPSREHGALHGEQLLAPWVLALMAPLVQPLDCALPLRSTRRDASARRDECVDFHVCRPLA